jgi:glutaconyl-CoA/methylmalonyl-CoA decarboxylase subunit gamma
MKYKVTLNGKTYEVEVEHGEAIIAAEYASLSPAPQVIPQQVTVQNTNQPAPQTAAKVSPKAGETVEAPIPGTVLKIFIQAGKQVKKGDVVLVIEAMKMENEILAPESGTLVAVYVSQGASIQSGDKLFTVA